MARLRADSPPSSSREAAEGSHDSPPRPEELTIDELARRTGTTVRNIRAHQSRGLLPPPTIRARTGYYGPEHVARVQQGELPIWRALTPNEDERLIREFILQLKLGQLSRAYFRNKFGVEPTDRFAEPLQRLSDWGFLSIHDDQIRLNREGLLQVDRLLHEFFLPQHRNARYV